MLIARPDPILRTCVVIGGRLKRQNRHACQSAFDSGDTYHVAYGGSEMQVEHRKRIADIGDDADEVNIAGQTGIGDETLEVLPLRAVTCKHPVNAFPELFNEPGYDGQEYRGLTVRSQHSD
jgi:hypothetical protein